ncbi:CU044_5270 family protein [Nonomuraea guangzhouensis]|uniref:CU044_5270 family protein n=1 Tax=Nonomuraea guangzhouensis TaxID=1291555 RepID=A0ABW4GT18_9ACTN|nr:CU044_5270 family protein [Nonomuraea guangzhouensis]
MNEFETLKTYHDSLPAPTSQATARARTLLAAAVEAETSPPRTSRRSRNAFRGGLVVALAAAMTAGVITLRQDDATYPLGTPPASAAELLRNAAAASARTDEPRQGQFTYVRRIDYLYYFGVGRGGSEWVSSQEVRREVWIPAADPDKALARSTFAKLVPVSGDSGEMSLPAEGTVEYQRAGQCPSSAALRVPAQDLGALPTDPDGLLRKVRADAEAAVRRKGPGAGAAPPSDDEIKRMIERTVVTRLFLLADTPLIDADTRATVFNALSRMPTATVVPDLSDPTGRRGVGASIRFQGPDGWEHEELIFEPKTYAFLGWRSWIEDEQADGTMKKTMSNATAVLETKVVDSMPEVPQDAKRPTSC